MARRALTGSDACVHLAGVPVEAHFGQILHANLQGTWSIYEAARLEGCPRVVFASSNHATGYTPVGEEVGPQSRVRPDTFYGVSKAFGEALGSMYHDKFGLRVACLRIGSAQERPLDVRNLSTWLSPGDLVRLVTACLISPELGFEIVYGASANTRGWWSLESGRRLGYNPRRCRGLRIGGQGGRVQPLPGRAQVHRARHNSVKNGPPPGNRPHNGPAMRPLPGRWPPLSPAGRDYVIPDRELVAGGTTRKGLCPAS